MDFSLTDQQKLIRDTVRQFMQAEVRALVKELEGEEQFPLDLLKKIADIGCCGMLMPEEWGGPGLDTVSYVLMIEEVARVYTAMSTALGVTNSAVQIPLLQFGTDAQKQKYLKRLASGEILGSFCLTEAAAGSDAAAIQATATRCASQSCHPEPTRHGERSEGSAFCYRLNGAKTWVTNGSVAGVFIIFAKTDQSAGGKGITAFLVEPSFQGFKIGRHEDKMGQRSSPSVEILLNDCEVPAANRLGEEGQGLKIALSALDGGRIGIAAQAVRLAEGALHESIKNGQQRRAFGKSISDFQAIQWMIADMQTELEAARGLTYYAAWLKESGKPMGVAACRAKLYASEMVNRVVYKAVQIHGSVGYSRATDVARMYHEALLITIYADTSEDHH